MHTVKKRTSIERIQNQREILEDIADSDLPAANVAKALLDIADVEGSK